MSSSNNNDNNNNEEKIIPDAPHMRSMAIMSSLPPAIPMPRSLDEPLVKSAPPRFFAETQLAAPKPWTVPEPIVLPTRYPLERSHVYIADASPQQVGQRISDCLRSESIAATYSETEAKINAETREHVEFSIRLWNTTDKQVVVEVQRLSGCCFLFCQAAKAVLRAAKGSAVEQRRAFSLPASLPSESNAVIEEGMCEGLQVAESLLKAKGRLDAHMLAMESMVQLSKASHSKSFCCRRILQNTDILSTLLALVEASRMDRSSDEEKLSELEEEHFMLMHRHALTILGNCLVVLQESRQLDTVLQEQGDVLVSSTFIESLVSQVRKADEQPHDACQAVVCLQALVQSSDSAKEYALEYNAPQALSQAMLVGRHKCLEDVVKELQAQL